MDLIASFNAHIIQTSHFITIDGILKNGVLHFLFDTGAVCSLIGTNSLFSDNEHEKREKFIKILKNEIATQQIFPRANPLKTANNQSITTYPCVSHNVSIEGTEHSDFYFDFSITDISLPLLGTSFSYDCTYSHTTNGILSITSMKKNAGSDYYSSYKVLDFDIVMAEYEKVD